jgi:DNA helicase-2/ATP-dependent DNA helicase PcrA
VLVDEYQDTNNLQCEIVKLLAKSCDNVTVVGDDAQSIYAFRGASVSNILEFEKFYPNATVRTLLTNYRSTPQILNLANESRKFAKEGFQKDLLSSRVQGETPAIVSCRDVNMQANFVAQRILELASEGVPFDDIAVLYRAHHHAMELQLELMRRQIPFVVRSGLRFFEQAHIKDVLSYLRFAYNPKDEISFRRAVRLHDGIGPHVAQKLWQELSTHGIDDVAKCRGILSGLSLGTKATLGLGNFLAMLDVLKHSKPGPVLKELLSIFYETYATVHFTNGQQRVDDIKQLANYANSFVSIEKLLSELMLLSEFGVEELPADSPEGQKIRKVTLSSVHQAKGLEWSHVFVVWLVEGRFPSELALREPNGLEEERRLFYVATTRAKDSLYLVHPNVARQSDWRQIMLRRSRFMEEITSLKKCDNLLADNWVVEDETKNESQPAYV